MTGCSGGPCHERDWVVVGATPAQLERMGYTPVGREFPVFLHPQTHEEYALARLERKVGPGYRGFTTQFSPEVTLEEDLQRRDLTVNAMAQAEDGHAHRSRTAARRTSPRGGCAMSRRPSSRTRCACCAWRASRRATRHLGFHVADETLALMRRMTQAGEVAALVPERVWQETERALG